MAAITALALIVAVALILFSVNPTAQENQDSINRQQRALEHQVADLNEIICSQAQTTANAYRFRSLTPSGRVEPIRHFLTRMQAQRQTLELSQGRDCPVAPGFPPFEYQLERALKQIEHILGSFSAKQREPVNRGVSNDSSPTPSQFQVPPDFGVPSFTAPAQPNGHHVGIGEEGVPYVPKKPKAPNDPPSSEPEAMPANERRQKAAPLEAPTTEEVPRASESPQPPQTVEASPPLREVTEGTEEALGNATEGLCTAIRQVHELC